ncbi:MAG: DNA polymerase III subunit gamma/tau, partial [Mesorhizobium sp.]
LVSAPEPTALAAPRQPEPETPPAVQVKSLADIVALAESHRDQLLKVNLRSHVRHLKIGPGRLDVGLTETAPKTLLGELKSRLESWTGQRWMVSLSNEAGGQTLAEAEAARRETALMDARADPAVAAVLARFPGARIIDVRIPDAPEADSVDDAAPIEPATDEDDET